MSHSGDANKMVSDTPRTDAAYFEPGATMYDLAGEMKRVERELNAANEKIEVLLISDCERLRIENELAAANERIKRLEAVVNDPEALWTNWLRGDVKLPAGIGDVRQYQDHIKRSVEVERWIPANTKPEGFERRVLLWIVWPQMHGWCDSPERLIGWWKHGPKCFALGDIENADHLVRYWMEIPDPTETKEAKP